MDDVSENVMELTDCPTIQYYFQMVSSYSSISSDITYLHVNIRSLIKNFSKLELLLCSVNRSVDVIILTEVGICERISSLYHIPSYNMHTELRSKRKGGGIIVYTHISHKFIPCKTLTIHSECIIGKITTRNNNNIVLFALYRPPSLNKNHFLTELDRLLCNYTNQDIILIGDINIDLKVSTNVSQQYLNLLSEHGLACGIRDYTRIESRKDSVTKSCIDHIFVRSPTQDVHCAALGTVLADHRVTVATMHSPATTRGDFKQIMRYNNTILRQQLNSLDWGDICQLTCPKHIYQTIKNNIINCYNKSMYTVKIKPSNRNLKNWVNKKIIKLSKEKDDKFIELKKDINNKILKLQFTKIRNKCNKVVEKTRNIYLKNEIYTNKNNPKVLWNIINRLTGRIKQSVDEVITNAFNNAKTRHIANNFSIAFKNSVQKIIPKCQKPLLDPKLYTKEANASIYIRKPSSKDIQTIISHIQTNKSPGVDKIRPIDIKNIKDKIIPVVKKLIETSIKTGKYPEELKMGVVRPIHKKGPKNEYDNYRPITILPTLNKIVEKYICNEIHYFYTKHEILSKQQYGFQPKKSTTMLLSDFTDFVNRKLNDKKHVLIVFIDFSKAFDTLRHDTLLIKLENSGIRGPLLKWCADYLTNRSYHVKIDQELSDLIPVSIGTAQGSVSGPLHYLAYVNDMNNIITGCKVYQYADDTCLIAEDRDIRVALSKLQTDFTLLNKWSHDAGLVLNAQKTKMLHISSAHNIVTYDHNIQLIAHDHECLHGMKPICDCKPIEQVSQFTYLGLTIDHRFNWSGHIDVVCNKLRAILAKFSILKYKIPLSVLLEIYTALADSIISYGLSSYGRTFPSYLVKIYNLQLRILKVIIPKKLKEKFKFNEAALFEFCKTHPVHIKVKKLLIIENYFKFNEFVMHSKLTRQITNKILKTIGAKNFYGERTTQYLVPRLINELPKNTRDKITPRNINQLIKCLEIN